MIGHMSLQILDIALAAIMIISGLLAMMRGFTREVLSLLAWVAAGFAAWWAITTPEMVAIARQYIEQDKVATIATGGAVFLVVLVVMSLISVRIGDVVLDSAIGAFDRTLGLIYGLARGLLLVVIAYMFYVWLVPPEKHEDWVRDAASLPLLRSVAHTVTGFMPPDIAQDLNDKLEKGQAADGKANPMQPSYGKGDKTRLDSLIESHQNKAE